MWDFLEDTTNYRRLRNQLAFTSKVEEVDHSPYGSLTASSTNASSLSTPLSTMSSNNGTAGSTQAVLDWTDHIVADMGAHLGGGGYADVYKGKWINVPDDSLLQRFPKVVVKKFRIDQASLRNIDGSGKGWGRRVSHYYFEQVGIFDASANDGEQILREIAAWQDLKHENIVPFVGVVQAVGEVPQLVSEMIMGGENAFASHMGDMMQSFPLGNVRECVKKNSSVCRKRLIEGITAGLDYMHGEFLFHL
jgi:serine/threonine protein kinase